MTRMKIRQILIILLSSLLLSMLIWPAVDLRIYKAFLPEGVQFYKLGVGGDLDWSPTGEFITGEGYERRIGGLVFLWPIGSTNYQVISDFEGFELVGDPALNPNGKSISYKSVEHGYEILEIDSGKKQIAPIWANTAWAIDGSGLYFTTYEGDLAYYDLTSMLTIDVYNVTSELREIWDLELSPDGKWMVMEVISNRGWETAFRVNPVLLSLEDYTEIEFRIDEMIDFLGWSHDGEWVIYRERYENIYSLNIIENCRSQALDFGKINAKFITSIAWSPVDDRVAMSGKLGSDFGIFIIEDEEFLEWPSLEGCTPLIIVGDH